MKKSEIDLILSILLIFAIFISITGFFNDISNTVKFGGVDLRNRVVGARLLIDKQDPYHYKWQKGDSPLFLDPRDNPDWKVNRVTVPPTVLMFHTSFSWLGYKIQRYLWLFVQWFLLLGSIFLFSKSSGSNAKSKLIWICGLFFVGSSFFWRLHVERGQIYILYVFLITLSYWIYTKKRNDSEIWSGIIAGIAMSLRPPLIVLSLPMLIYKRINFIAGNIIGIIIGIGSTFFIATSSNFVARVFLRTTSSFLFFSSSFTLFKETSTCAFSKSMRCTRTTWVWFTEINSWIFFIQRGATSEICINASTPSYSFRERNAP